ncbi:MAG: hypothetical protein Q9168_001007 [Polycauliona sp. 1 TL-2023]
MSLKRRLCRFAATHPSDHIWISDDILDHAVSRYMKLCVGRRHGSAVPGPLEARKRAAKRRLMGLAPTMGGLDPHPGFLAGLGRGHENQQSWQWQNPKLPQSKHPPRPPEDNGWWPDVHVEPNPADSPALPAWLINYTHEHEIVAAEKNQDSEPMGEVDPIEVVPDPSCHAKPKSVEDRLEESTSLNGMRLVISSLPKHDPMRKVCSRLALRQLLETTFDMDEILGFWVDPLLNPWRAGNLPFFVTHCVNSSRIEEVRRFCDWNVRQFYVGACSDRNVGALITELSRFKDQDARQEILVSLCQSVAQALRSSPVLRTEDISFATYSTLLAVLFDDVYTSSRLELGFDLVKVSSSAQLKNLACLVCPVIKHWVNARELSRRAELGSTTLSLTISRLLNAMPYDKLLEIIRDVSWHFLSLSQHEPSSRTIWRRLSLWWSAIKALESFKHIKKTSLWSEISGSLRTRRELAIVSVALKKINKNLSQSRLQAAYGTFLQYPRVALERCPDLAEALILDPKRHWMTAVMLRETRQAIVLANQQSAGNDYAAKHLQRGRVHLLERMALAYAQQDHIPIAMTFYYVYGCWKIQERDNLGPMGPAMLHAITLSGIVKPLEARRQVSRTRLEWILRMAAEVEGIDASTNLGATIHKWLNEGYHNARRGRDEVLHQSLSQRHHQQGLRVQGTDPWERLTVMAQDRPDAAPGHRSFTQSVRRASPVINMYSAALAIEEGGIESPQTSAFSLQNEEADGDGQLAEETFMSALSSEPAAFMESTDSSPIPVASEDAAKQFVDPMEINPSTALVEGLQVITERNVHDTTWNRRVTIRRNGLGSSAFIPLKLPPDTMIQPPRDVHQKITRGEAIKRGAIAHKVQALSIRLNASHIIGLNDAAESEFQTRTSWLPELSSIPPCSLALSAANPAQLEEVYKWRERILGSDEYKWPWLRHGMKEYQGPMTFSNVKQPALGPGMLHVAGVLERAEKGERRLDLGFGNHDRAEARERESGSSI